MKNKTIYLLLGIFLASIVVSCGNNKEKELQKRIAELEQQVQASKPATNTTAAEPEVKPEGPLPMFEFPEDSHDFGKITEGDVVEKIFKFKNVGEAPLIIESARASCGCTVPEYPKTPIGIGEEAEVLVRFNSKGKSGVQNKTVTITANTYPKITRLRIRAEVAKLAE